MNATVPQLVPPIILWLVKRQGELGGPVPGEDLARELRCSVLDLPKVQKILRRQGWVFEAVTEVIQGRMTNRRTWYTGRMTLGQSQIPEDPSSRSVGRPKAP